MKKVIILVILSLVFACENSNNDCLNSKYCYDLVKSKPEKHLITDQELDTVKLLFSSNNLKLDNYLVYQLLKDNLGLYHVKCDQYLNNTRLFSNNVIFHFNKQRKYTTLSGEIISNLNIDTSPTKSVCEVINRFLSSIKEDGYYNKDQISLGCFYCELGYYDLNSGSGMESKNFKLAWKIKTKTSDIPYGYFTDKDLSLIYFDNGIRY